MLSRRDAFLSMIGACAAVPALAANAPFGSWTTTLLTGNTVLQTGVFQQVLAANTLRRGCMIQNQGTHTMYVYFGGNTTVLPPNANTSFAVQLSPGQQIQCLQGSEVVLQDLVSITGTAGDGFSVTSQ